MIVHVQIYIIRIGQGIDKLTSLCYYVVVMKNKIENAIYGYNPKEFLPIRVDGRLANRNKFVAYKISRLVKGQLI